MTFWKAQELAFAGRRVRCVPWRYWWVFDGALWFKETTKSREVLVASDVNGDAYRRDDWTTEDFSEEDPCARPPASKPVFVPPGVWVSATWSGDVLTIRGGIGEGSPGWYRLTFRVDGATVADELASGTQIFTLTVPSPWAAKFTVELKAESVLPLEPWSGRADKVIRPAFTAFDFAIIRYLWTSDGGGDLDSRTALIDVDASVDGRDVGWPANGDFRYAVVSGASGNYLTFGGDDTTPPGVEAVLVDFQKLAADFPGLTYIRVRLRANWYGSRASGDFTVQFATYLGGVMSPSGTDFINTGGTVGTNLDRASNVASNTASNADGESFATLVYHVPSRTATLTA